MSLALIGIAHRAYLPSGISSNSHLIVHTVLSRKDNTKFVDLDLGAFIKGLIKVSVRSDVSAGIARELKKELRELRGI